jgi:tRNA uridine 5-carboxymethylaminomethyl modification enzyme
LTKFLCRSGAEWEDVAAVSPELAGFSGEVVRQVKNDVKYAGYVERQQREIARQQRLAEKLIPYRFDYAKIGPLRTEAREKLTRIRPANLAQAGRISGITPADIALLMVHLENGGQASSAQAPG